MSETDLEGLEWDPRSLYLAVNYKPEIDALVDKIAAIIAKYDVSKKDGLKLIDHVAEMNVISFEAGEAFAKEA